MPEEFPEDRQLSEAEQMRRLDEIPPEEADRMMRQAGFGRREAEPQPAEPQAAVATPASEEARPPRDRQGIDETPTRRIDESGGGNEDAVVNVLAQIHGELIEFRHMVERVIDR